MCLLARLCGQCLHIRIISQSLFHAASTSNTARFKNYHSSKFVECPFNLLSNYVIICYMIIQLWILTCQTISTWLSNILPSTLGAMEMPQHGNGSKSEFGSVSFFFQELSEIPQKLKSVEGFPNILGRFPLYLHLICFPFFGVRFLFFFGSVSGFQKKF